MDRKRLDRGLVEVYTGDGKGKTTAAVGLGLRAAGHGFRVAMIQFMKGDPEYGELKALAAVPGFTWRQCGLPTFVKWREPSPVDLRMAEEGLAEASKLLDAGDADVVILDEILCAVDYGLFGVDRVLALIDRKPPHVELVLTGRGAPAEVIARADLVSEVREVKHPFTGGVAARKGIEY
jgi:cob(I)alamin adenosyltransferase